MTLRPATRDDCRRLYEWRTDPATEANSLAPAPASYEEHVRWFERIMADLRVKLFIAEFAGDPVGTGRLNIEGKTAEFSVTVAPALRGRGYGSGIIQLLMTEARNLGLARISARVLGSNVASLLAFLDARFVPEASIIRMERSL